MIDTKTVKKGHTLKDLETGKTFTVLCSCAKSKPRRHTRRYVRKHPEEFDYVR